MAAIDPSKQPQSDAGMLNATCLELLLIELVPMAQRIAQDLAARDMQDLGRAGEEVDVEEVKENVVFRLEKLGYRVGLGVAEKYSGDRPRFTDNLDVVKFICKDLWTAVFRKQIDNLKTNHRGIYVLTDTTFRPLTKISLTRTELAGPESSAALRAKPFLHFPAGILRGALAALGINATVQAEVAPDLPSAVFQIRTAGAGGVGAGGGGGGGGEGR